MVAQLIALHGSDQKASPGLEVQDQLLHALLCQLLSVVSLCLDRLQLCVLLPVHGLQLPALLAGAAWRCLSSLL